MFVSPEDKTKGPSRVLFIGEPGVGKTRLASRFPDPYFLDAEFGAGSTGAPRLLIEPGKDAMRKLEEEIKSLKRAPFVDGAIQYEKEVDGQSYRFPVRTLVVDSIDAFQQSAKYSIMGNKDSMSQSDWGKLLDVTLPVVMEWSGLPIHVVVISHIHETQGDDDAPGVVGLAVQGSLRAQMPRWFDYIIHLRSTSDDVRIAFVQPTVFKNQRFIAKDRHDLFENLTGDKTYLRVPLADDGMPARDIPNLIDSHHRLATPKTKRSLVNIANHEWGLSAAQVGDALREAGMEFDPQEWDRVLATVERYALDLEEEDREETEEVE